MAAATFRFTIDGNDVEATEGQSVIEACDAAGIYILASATIRPPARRQLPRLYLQNQWPQQCGLRHPAAHGMVIESNTPQLTDDRRAVIEMLFVEGNHPALLCCERGLRVAGTRLPPWHGGAGPALSVARAKDRRHPPDIYLDHDRCISARAVFALHEWRMARQSSDLKAAVSRCGSTWTRKVDWAIPRWLPSTRRQVSVRSAALSSSATSIGSEWQSPFRQIANR